MKKSLIVAAVVVPILGILWIGWKSAGPICGEQVVLEETSPDGRYVAVWMRRDCGATTAYADHVNMRLAKDKFEKSFLNGTIKKDEVFTLDTAHNRLLRVEWTGPRKLTIEYLGAANNLPHQNSWNDILIEYPH